MRTNFGGGQLPSKRCRIYSWLVRFIQKLYWFLTKFTVAIYITVVSGAVRKISRWPITIEKLPCITVVACSLQQIPRWPITIEKLPCITMVSGCTINVRVASCHLTFTVYYHTNCFCTKKSRWPVTNQRFPCIMIVPIFVQKFPGWPGTIQKS